MIGGALPLMRMDIAMTDAQAGWVIGTAFALPYCLTALTLAVVLRGRRASIWWLIGGLVVWTLASLATGAAHSVATLTLARAALGIGQAMFVPVAIAWLVDDTGAKDRARALATFTSGSTIGRSAALLMVGALLPILAVMAHNGPVLGIGGNGHWRGLYGITALPNLVMLPFLIGIGVGKAGPPMAIDAPRPGMPATVDTRTGDRPAPDAMPVDAPPVDWGTLALFFVVAIMPVLLIQSMGGWLPSVLVRDRGIAPAQAATLLGAITLVAAPAGQIVGGWLMTRFASWHDRIPAIVLVALTATLLPLAVLIWAPGLAGAIAGIATANITLGIASFCGLFGVQMLGSRSTRITVNGLFLALVTLVGVGIGPLLTGVLATIGDHRATDGGPLGGALFATGLIACAVCAIAVAAVHRRYREGLA